MDDRLMYWVLIRITVSLSVVAASRVFLLIHKHWTHQAASPKKPVDAPNGLPIVGHALSFSKDMAGFTTRLK